MSRFRHNNGFSLLELLVSMAILTVMVTVLTAISGHALRIWQRGESDNQHRQSARLALDTISRDLRAVTMPLNRSGTNSLQFVINPDVGTSYKNHDALFWQAPVATDTSSGNLAIVGYFVRWNGAKASLCRLLVNPSSASYIYAQPNAWVTSDILDTECPANSNNQYRGLFLENVIGIWVSACNASGTSVLTSGSYNSRDTQGLPATVEISMVSLDRVSASKVTGVISSSGFSDAPSFVNSLPKAIRSGAIVTGIKVNLESASGW